MIEGKRGVGRWGKEMVLTRGGIVYIYCLLKSTVNSEKFIVIGSRRK